MRYIYNLLILFTLICFSSVFISPDIFWFGGFLALCIPLLLIFHFILLIYYLKKYNRKFIVELAVLGIGFVFIKITYAISLEPEGAGNLKVLSYNVRVFNTYAHLKNDHFISSKKMISWSVENDAAIKCFQEYYNNDDSKIFNVTQKMYDAGWTQQYVKSVFTDRNHGEFGIALFSKYPIVARGEIVSEDGAYQNSIYADLLINNDTVRLYNVHLESMSINENDVLDADRFRTKYIDTGYRLRRGFITRAKQVKYLAKHIDRCPYRIILCGDFNELPYSYPYFTIRNRLKNAFEQVGNGFGFSYNGKLFFLRIDNQFFSEQVNIHDFHTYRHIDYSDHFPITANYSLSN